MTVPAIAPLAYPCGSTACYFFTLPNELFLMVSKLLPLKDRLSFADSCIALRSLISDGQCTEECTKAGLSIPPGVTPRAMVKLLLEPRVGVSNWTLEGGEAKRRQLDFSKIWSISSAVRESLIVDLHPAFTASKYMFLCEQKSFDQVHIRVARNESDILLVNHRLYLYEYATSPPLRELRIIIKDEEGPFCDGDVAFRIKNSSGVTLGDYYQGLYKFLRQPPDVKMKLTQLMIQTYENFCYQGSIIVDDDAEAKRLRDEVQSSFDRNCSTNLAMMDAWSVHLCDGEKFSEQAIRCELPFYRGSDLALVMHVTDAETARDTIFLAAVEYGINWGEPRRCYKYAMVPNHMPALRREDANKELWDGAPVIEC